MSARQRRRSAAPALALVLAPAACSAALAACAPASPPARAASPAAAHGGAPVWSAFPMPYDNAATEQPEPEFAFATDSVVALMALPPLRSVRLPDGALELRIWIGFGIWIPHVLLRLAETPETTRGELVHWWSTLEETTADPRFEDFMTGQRERAGRYGCRAAQSGPHWEERLSGEVRSRRGWSHACRIDLGHAEPHWPAFLARLDRLGVRDIPDPDSLEPEAVRGFDGTSIEIEVLEGDRYRTYTYWNPGLQPWPEAERVDEILELVMRLGQEPDAP